MHNTYSTVGAVNVALRNNTESVPFAHQSITVLSTAVSVLTVPDGATSAILIFEADNLSAWTDDSKIARYWMDNTAAPTTAVGMPAPNMTVIELVGKEALRTFHCILTEAQTAYVHVQYFK